VDNADTAAVTLTGTGTASSSVGGFVGADYLHDDNTGKETTMATFQPAGLTEGEYEVYARWTAAPNRASAVPFEIRTPSVVASVTVDQRTQGGEWVRMGAPDDGRIAAAESERGDGCGMLGCTVCG